MLKQVFEKFSLFSIVLIFSTISYSQSFYSSSGNYLGKLDYYSKAQRNCGNCAVLLDKLGNKIGEVSPNGGYRQFTNNEGDVICSWTMNNVYFINNRKYSAIKDAKQTNSYIIYEGNKKIAIAKIMGLKINFYSTNGNLKMSASCLTNSYGQANGHDFDVSISYFLRFCF